MPADLAEALRSALHEGYSDASDAEMDDAVANVLDSMSAAEAFNFASGRGPAGCGPAGPFGPAGPRRTAARRTAAARRATCRLPVAAGSAAAAQGLVLTQQPEVLFRETSYE